jgi:hypothetical protein
MGLGNWEVGIGKREDEEGNRTPLIVEILGAQSMVTAKKKPPTRGRGLVRAFGCALGEANQEECK